MANKPHRNSYGQILKSSSIIGGAQGINYLIGMVRVKLVAVLLGPDSPAVQDLRRLFSLAAGYGYTDWLVFDPSVVRGLAYYTGVCLCLCDSG